MVLFIGTRPPSLTGTGRGSLPSLELMVSQPDGFIKRTDAARPCQGQKEEGSGPACQGLCMDVESHAREALPWGVSLSLLRASRCPLPTTESGSKPVAQGCPPRLPYCTSVPELAGLTQVWCPSANLVRFCHRCLGLPTVRQMPSHLLLSDSHNVEAPCLPKWKSYS